MPLPASSSQRKRNPPSHIPHSHGRDAHPLIRTGFCIDTKLIKVRLSIEMHILIAFLLFGFARVAKSNLVDCWSAAGNRCLLIIGAMLPDQEKMPAGGRKVQVALISYPFDGK
jgi:hypothetical protein